MTNAAKPKSVTPKKEAMSPDTSPARLAALAKLPDEAVQRAVAKNPRTPAKALKKLGSSRDKFTRKAVAGNPNTPAEIMSGLGGQFPVELLGNPALDLMLLENPDLFSGMPIGTLRSLAKRENCPAGLLAYMARAATWDESLQRSLVQNPNTPREVIEGLVGNGRSEEIKEAARLHVTLCPELDAEFAEAEFWKSLANQAKCKTLLHWQLLSDIAVPEWVRANMAAWQLLRGLEGCSVLTSPGLPLPVPILESLAANAYLNIKIRRAACFNPAAPDWLPGTGIKNRVIKALRAHKKESFVRLADMFKTCPPEYRVVLAEHPFATDKMKKYRLPEWEGMEWQEEAASSPFAWPELFERLANDKCSSARCKVAANPKTPIPTLEKLAGDEDGMVRYCVGKNSSTPVSTLEKLASVSVARNPHTPASALEKLAEYKDSDFRSHVAKNPNTPASVLEKLAGDEHDWVRDKVAANPNTPASALEKLAGNGKPWIRCGVAKNPHTPASVLEKLAGDEDGFVRCYVAANSNTPASVLEKLAGDKDSSVRYYVAKNPNTPASALEKLVGDEGEPIPRDTFQYFNLPIIK